jgi:hypothetical protein
MHGLEEAMMIFSFPSANFRWRLYPWRMVFFSGISGDKAQASGAAMIIGL